MGFFVGGPDLNDNFSHERDNYEQTEPATYNNGPLIGTLARINGGASYSRLLPVVPNPKNKPQPSPSPSPSTKPQPSPSPATKPKPYPSPAGKPKSPNNPSLLVSQVMTSS